MRTNQQPVDATPRVAVPDILTNGDTGSPRANCDRPNPTEVFGDMESIAIK